MEKYAFFLDIDGTLASRGRIHPENIRVIKEARKLGHYVFINTGRSYANILDFVFEGTEYDGFVCALGHDIRVGGKQIFSKTLSYELLYKLNDIAFNMPGEIFYFEGEDNVFCTETWKELHKIIKLKNKDELKTKYRNEKISKMSTSPVDKKCFEEVLDELKIYDHGRYYELAYKDLNKATGMFLVADYIGVPKERCVAIGDSLNDEDMLSSAGISVVMENGHEKMKEIADMITLSSDEGGVAEAIKKIIKL